MIEIPFSIWSGLLLTVSVWILIVLYRILRILKKVADGEPSSEELRKIEFKKIQFK